MNTDCPDCSHLQPVGVTKTRPCDRIKDPFRVYLSGDTEGPFVDAKDLDHARATACGHENAIIHTREEESPVPDVWPRIQNLPEKERKPFSEFLDGQTCPLVEGDDVHDRYYPWDYENWKRSPQARYFD